MSTVSPGESTSIKKEAVSSNEINDSALKSPMNSLSISESNDSIKDHGSKGNRLPENTKDPTIKKESPTPEILQSNISRFHEENLTNPTTSAENHLGEEEFNNKFFSLDSLDKKSEKIGDHDFSFLEDEQTFDGTSKASHNIDLSAATESLQNDSHNVNLDKSLILDTSDQQDTQHDQHDPKDTLLLFKTDKKSTDNKLFTDSNVDLGAINIEDQLKHFESLDNLGNLDNLNLRNLENLGDMDQYDNLQDSLESLNDLDNLTDKMEKLSGSSKEQTMSPEKSDLFGDASSSNRSQQPDLSNLSNIPNLKESSKSPANTNLFNLSLDQPNSAASNNNKFSRLPRAQSEALETTIPKPELNSYSASVPQSPTLPPSNPLFPPTTFSNSPLKKSQTRTSSPSLNGSSKKASRLSSLSKIHSDKSSTLQAINASLEKPEVHQIQTDEAPRVSAYARLDFPSFTFYVQTLQVSLGRSAEKGSGMVDVDLGPVKAISRRHAKIFYNFGTQRFELSVLGRNGAFVDDTFVDTGSTVPLQNGTKIQIGQISFSFVLPSANSSRGSQEPEEARRPTASIPIKQEDSGNTVHPTSNGSTNKSQQTTTRSPSLAAIESDSTQTASETNKQSNQNSSLTKEIIKTESKPISKQPTKKQTTRREYLPEEIPEEYREKPAFSYSHLIATALRAHPEASGISLSEIYKSIQDIFPYYKYCPHGWQNSVRHNLSSNKAFRKISKEGKGWLWGIDEEYFQERERLKKKAAVSLKAKTTAVVSTTTKVKPLLNEKDGQQEQQQQQIDQLSYQQSQLHYQQQTQQFHQQNQQFQQQLQAQAQNKSSSTGLSDPSTFIPSFYTDHKSGTHRTPHVLETAPIPFSSIPPSISNPTNLPPETLADLNLVYDREFAQKQNKQQQQNNNATSNSENKPTSTFNLNSVPTTAASLSKPATPAPASVPIKKERAKTIAELASEIQIDSNNDRLYRPDYANGTRESFTDRKKSTPSNDVTVTAVTNSKPALTTSSSASIHMVPAVATNSIAQNDAILNSPRYQQYYANSASTPPIPSTRVTNAISGLNSNSQASTASTPSAASSVLSSARGQGSVQSMAAGQNTFRMTQAPKLSGPPSQATQSQLQMQTSVPQMRVNPQIPQGVRDPKSSSISTSPVLATADLTSMSGTGGPSASATSNWQTQNRTGKSVSPPASSVAKSTSPSIPITNSSSAAVVSSAAAKPAAKPTTAGSASNSTGTAVRKPNVNANLSNLNLPKETLRILNLLQDKIKAQMEASGQVINSALLTNALAIAISQLTKNSGSGGGAAAITNLLKGKNQAQLVNALATAISSAKKTGNSSASGSGTHISKPKPPAAPAPVPSSVSKPVPMAAPMIPGLSKLHPPVTVPAAISSPASLNAGLPPHLSGIAAKVPLSNMVPRVKQASPLSSLPVASTRPVVSTDVKKSSPAPSKSIPASAPTAVKPLSGVIPSKVQLPVSYKSTVTAAIPKASLTTAGPMPPKISMPVPSAIKAAMAAAAAAAAVSPVTVKTQEPALAPVPVKASSEISATSKSTTSPNAISEESATKRSAAEQIQSSTIKKEKIETESTTVKLVEAPKSAEVPVSTSNLVATASTVPLAKSASPQPSSSVPTGSAAASASAKPAVQPSPAPAKSKAEMISEMLAKASKLTNPTPSIKAALLQLQAHATKLGLPIPENLKRILNDETPALPGAAPDSADKKRKAADETPASQNSKVQKTS